VVEEPRAAIWDMDGVLVLSGDFHYEAWVETLRDYGLSMSREQFEQTFGMNNQNLLRRIYGPRLRPEQIHELADRKEARYRELIRGRMQALPGVEEWLQRLHDAGWRQAVASSAPMANVAAVINQLDCWHFFDAVLTGERLPRSKPDPAIFLQAAAAVAVPPERCVVIEDGTVGVEAACRAGMRAIAVTTTHPASEFQEADIIVERLNHLPPDSFDHLIG